MPDFWILKVDETGRRVYANTENGKLSYQDPRVASELEKLSGKGLNWIVESKLQFHVSGLRHR